MRDDPAFIFDDVTMTNVTTATPVTVVNEVESGILGDQAPVGWTYLKYVRGFIRRRRLRTSTRTPESPTISTVPFGRTTGYPGDLDHPR